MKHHRGQDQHGHALLLGLMVLMVVSAAWLGVGSSHRVEHRGVQTLQLAQARAALIHYAVSYIDHYGPQGAGPGHFPCPDTDPPVSYKNQTTEPWSKDGPNPPCGRHAVATGWLPRHVNVNGGRYHFHARPQQRLRYAVSGQFINNPINREVNPNTKGDIKLGQFNDIIAVLGLPSLSTISLYNEPEWSFGKLETDGAYAIVRADAIWQPLLQRVASWLLTQLNNAIELRCGGNDGLSSCAQEWLWPAECDATSATMLLHWLTDLPMHTACSESVEVVLTMPLWLEGVPISKHWFVRNHWYRFVDIQIDNVCKPSPGLCRVGLINNSKPTHTDNIHLPDASSHVRPRRIRLKLASVNAVLP